MRKRVLGAGVAVVLAFAPAALTACDAEDVGDVKEGVTDVKRKVEKGAKKLEKQIDKADTDGRDD